MERDEMPTGQEKELLMQALGYPRRAVDVDSAVYRIKALNQSKRDSQPLYRYLGIAAALIVAIVGIKYTLFKTTPQTKTYTTAKAQVLSINLTDGSRITLAPATTLRVTGRVVDLAGEAIFTVENKNKEPFVVKSGRVETRVLGTTFSVRAYDNSVRVAVAEGRVGVGSTIASDGDIVTVDNDRVEVERNTNVASLISWSRGVLTFDHTTLAAATPDLERWYDIKISVKDSALLERSITASFDGTSLPALASTLSSVLEAKASVNGNTLTFTQR